MAQRCSFPDKWWETFVEASPDAEASAVPVESPTTGRGLAVVIRDVLSRKQCEMIRAFGETVGMPPSGYDPTYRTCDRLRFDSHRLSAWLWARVRHLPLFARCPRPEQAGKVRYGHDLEDELSGVASSSATASSEAEWPEELLFGRLDITEQDSERYNWPSPPASWSPESLSPGFRLIRYHDMEDGTGGSFTCHFDYDEATLFGKHTFLSFTTYLTDGFEEGSTNLCLSVKECRRYRDMDIDPDERFPVELRGDRLHAIDEAIDCRVTPVAGNTVVLLCGEGTVLHEGGIPRPGASPSAETRKWLLRTDVVFDHSYPAWMPVTAPGEEEE
jgi:hypothetical protein